LALIASIILLIFLIQRIDPDLILYGDTFQYWAAGKLFLSGDNPYDYENLSALKETIGFKSTVSEDAISMMLYPPWIFPLLIPFSISTYTTSRFLWLFFHIIIVFLSSRRIWYLYRGPKKYEILAFGISFSFTPTLYVLGVGHITTLHLIGIVIFLSLLNDHNRKSDLSAGFAIGLSLLKPQLLLIYLISISIWIIFNKKWWILTGVCSFVILNLLIASLFNLNLITQYLDAIVKYPMGTWATPTLGMFLRLNFGINKNFLQILPTLFGIIWVVFYWFRKRNNWNWYKETPLLLLISFVFSPYTWTYDMVILIIPIIYTFVHIVNTGFTGISILSTMLYIVINIFTFIMQRTRFDFWFYWLAPVLLLWFVITEGLIDKSIKRNITKNKGLNAST